MDIAGILSELDEERFERMRKRELASRLEGPGVPMYDPSLGRIVYVKVDWPERNS